MKVANAAIFYLNKEDHTLGHLLRDQLLKDPKVKTPARKIINMRISNLMLNVSDVFFYFLQVPVGPIH